MDASLLSLIIQTLQFSHFDQLLCFASLFFLFTLDRTQWQRISIARHVGA